MEEQAIADRLRLEAREQQVINAMERKSREKAVEIEENRLKSSIRISEVVEKNKEMQRQKRKQFEIKQAEAIKLKAIQQEQQKERLKKLADDRASKEARQKEKKEQSKRQLEERKSRILNQLNDREKFKGVVEAKREDERAYKNLKDELKKEDKRQNVERIRRMGEYARLQTLTKLESDDNRTCDIKEQKELLLEDRRKMAHENFLRKAAVKDVMDAMRVSNKFVDIEEVINRKKSGGGRKRSKRREDDDDF